MLMKELETNKGIIVIEGGEQQNFVIEKIDETPCLTFDLKCGSHLNLYILSRDKAQSSAGCDITARLDSDSRLNVFVGMISVAEATNRFTIHLDAPGAEAQLNGFTILTDNDRCTTEVTVNHHAPHCSSNQLFKYIVEDTARGNFSGLIRVDHGAYGTTAYQNNRNILSTSGARMNSDPQLEIYCDDVKCSHGSATGQLNEQALFYMRSRGIDLPEARSMLMNAFMSDVIDTVGPDDLRETLKTDVEHRLLR